jgi:hypothetical protein
MLPHLLGHFRFEVLAAKKGRQTEDELFEPAHIEE